MQLRSANRNADVRLKSSLSRNRRKISPSSWLKKNVPDTANLSPSKKASIAREQDKTHTLSLF
jgi:hypothetical protein